MTTKITPADIVPNTAINNIRLQDLDFTLWLDGEYISSKEAITPILNHSLHYGGGVFEGLISRDSHIFKLEEHTQRLFQSAKLLGMDIAFTPEEINEAHHELLKRNNLKNAYFRPFVWRDTDSIRILPMNPKYRIMIAAWEMTARPSKALRINVSKWVKPSGDMFPVGAKASAQYGLLSLVAQEAQDAGFNDSIMLDINGMVAECTSANLFFIKGGKLLTPTTNYCLNGITRQTVIEISSNLGIECEVADISPSYFDKFDSAFVTGTACELQEICHINYKGQEFNYNPSPLFERIKTIYSKMIRGENE